MPIAVIAFDFDPLLRLGGDLTVRWQTVALAAVVMVCLATAGILAKRSGLRADDLLYIVIGAAPGAVVGGRIGYALLVPEAFRHGPLAMFDPSIGGFELGLSIVGGLATGAIVALLLGAAVGRWAHVMTIPLLTAIVGGKLTMALGGDGQGRPFDGDWATAYVGRGPWVELATAAPSHPSQIYEAIGTVLIALLILVATSLGLFRSFDGRRLLVGLAGWAAVRAVVSTTWRDPAVVGTVPSGGLIAIGIGVAAVGGIVLLSAWRSRRAPARADAGQPAWPDPEARPRF